MHQYLASCVTERTACVGTAGRSHNRQQQLLILGIPVKSETRAVLHPGLLREPLICLFFVKVNVNFTVYKTRCSAAKEKQRFIPEEDGV